MDERAMAFWQRYCATLAPRQRRAGPSHEPWSFGNTEEMGNALGARVREGVKTATSVLVWEIESGGDWSAPVGDIELVTES